MTFLLCQTLNHFFYGNKLELVNTKQLFHSNIYINF